MFGETMFNLFRKAGEATVLCAVPDGGALPSFLRGSHWSFEGKVGDVRDRLTEADRPLFAAVVETTGYFVFAPLDGSPA